MKRDNICDRRVGAAVPFFGIHACAMLVTILSVTASAGDRDPAFRACVRGCATVERCEAWLPTPSLRLLGWSCVHECGYSCMWRLVDERAEAGQPTLQYHGKWPFRRLLGVQEPAAALLSALNGAAHAVGLWRCWPLAAEVGGLRGWLWRGLGLAAVNAWLWAAVFHCRDLYWTQCADYFSAMWLVCWGCFAASALLLRLPEEEAEVQAAKARAGGAAPATAALRLRTSVGPLALGGVLVAGFGAHVRRMLRAFDYGYNMRAGLAMGALHLLLYVAWWRGARARRPHAWRVVALNGALSLSVGLEVLDFPPVLHTLDAHALWHAATAPLAHLLWRGFIEPELRWCKRGL